jgi:energy-coupling factor transport system substrate-specific component
LLRYIGAAPAGDLGGLERTILVLRAAGVSAGSRVASLQRAIRPDGSVSEQTNLTSFAVLALRAAGVAPPPATIAWLARQHNSDGGFGFATAGGSSDVDDTGAVLEALAGREPARAVRFVAGQQNPDGGFPSQAGGDSNAQSTAWAVQGLIAAGAESRAVDRALGYLRSLIAPDGHVRYSRGADQTPVWVTAEALMALARKPLPLAPPVVPAHRTPRPRPVPVARPVLRATPVAQPPRAARRLHAAASAASIAQLALDAGAGAAVLLALIHAG